MSLFRFAAIVFALLPSAAYADAFGGGPTSASVSAGPPFYTNPAVTASAYTANYAIGGLQKVPMGRTTVRPSLILNGIGVFSKSGITASMAVYAFTAATNSGALNSTCNDHAAFVLSNSDAQYLIPGFPITLTPAATAGTTQTMAGTNVNVTVQNADTTATTNIYFCWVTTGTPTPGSTSDLIFTYTGLQD